MSTKNVYPNYVNGAFQVSQNPTLLNINPANKHEVLGHVPLSTAEDLENIIGYSIQAQIEWNNVSLPKRGQLLDRVAKTLRQKKDHISYLMTREEGKTLAESSGELDKAANVLEFFSGYCRNPVGDVLPSEIPKTFAYTQRVPLGIVGMITPWNFPASIPIWKMAPALLAGNAVILKPSELTPETSIALIELFDEVGFPKGLIQMLHGNYLLGQALAAHPKIRAISFTGSNIAGTDVLTRSAPLMKKTQCEMGGKNPVIVLEDADLSIAIPAIALGAFGSTGQRCTATSRVIVEEKLQSAIVDGLVEHAKRLVLGSGLLPETTLGPSVSENQMNKVLKYHAIAQEESLDLVIGGRRNTSSKLEDGYFTEATIYRNVSPSSRLAREEIFGPVITVIPVKNFSEAIDVANQVDYGLSSSIFTRDIARCFEYTSKIETGILHINSATIGGEAHMPFGGLKNTSTGGREMGHTAIDFYTEWKTVYIDYSGGLRSGNLY